ncbi:MAG: hypothetical protein ACTSRA_09385 [Promethearchaeota archaeon]
MNGYHAGTRPKNEYSKACVATYRNYHRHDSVGPTKMTHSERK